MIVGFRHVGIVVRDMERELLFWRDQLGLKVVKEAYESGVHLDSMLDLLNVRVKTVKLEIPGGGMIELLEFLSHASMASARKIYHRGPSHVSFTVDDLDAEYLRLVAEGVDFLSDVVVSGSCKVCFALDPEGNFVELVEVLQ